MGSYLDFKNSSEIPRLEGSGVKPAGNFPLAQQSSIYSLTFDELQNTIGGVGKDFGSMNMDELLKNIWTAEEIQAMASSAGAGGGGGTAPSGNLQRQGSLTLPRTLSQKTVDEVWKDLFQEGNGAKEGGGTGGSHLQQRQPTLGEMTLEEFLVRAGVVREDAQPIPRPNNFGFFGEPPQPNNGSARVTLAYQHLAQNNAVLANQIAENTSNNNSVSNHTNILSVNASGVRSPQPLFPKQATVAFASSMPSMNNVQLASAGARGPVVRVVDPSINSGLVHSSVIPSGAAALTTMVAAGSPLSQLSSEGIVQGSVDASSISSPPFMLSGGAHGKKHGGTVERAMERRHRRMIKNRESAARSRARKQAYTLELEAEVEKLKKINQELQRKQEEILETQNCQIAGKIKGPWANKRRCLRRTLTGPW